jgi:hypothetical protein
MKQPQTRGSRRTTERGDHERRQTGPTTEYSSYEKRRYRDRYGVERFQQSREPDGEVKLIDDGIASSGAVTSKSIALLVDGVLRYAIYLLDLDRYIATRNQAAQRVKGCSRARARGGAMRGVISA